MTHMIKYVTALLDICWDDERICKQSLESDGNLVQGNAKRTGVGFGQQHSHTVCHSMS